MDESKVKVLEVIEPTPKSYPQLILETEGPMVNSRHPRKRTLSIVCVRRDDNRGAATVFSLLC